MYTMRSLCLCVCTYTIRHLFGSRYSEVLVPQRHISRAFSSSVNPACCSVLLLLSLSNKLFNYSSLCRKIYCVLQFGINKHSEVYYPE